MINQGRIRKSTIASALSCSALVFVLTHVGSHRNSNALGSPVPMLFIPQPIGHVRMTHLKLPNHTPAHFFKAQDQIPASPVRQEKTADADSMALVPEVEIENLNLNSNLLPYTLHFSGQLNCDGTPCAGRIEIYFNTDNNPDSRVAVQTDQDGRYTVDIPIREQAEGELAWRVFGRKGTLLQQEELKGRFILVDQTASFEHQVNLHG